MNRLTVTPEFDDPYGRGHAAADARELERRFRAAARHSRLVRVLRLAIPSGVVVALAMVLGLAWFNPLSMISNLPVEIGNLVISGTTITMESPRVTGFTRDNRAYELTARAASQDITRPDRLELRQMRGKVEMEDKTVVELTATNGLYDTKTEMLNLTDNIIIKSSNGYEGHLSEAVIDIRKGKVISDRPVELRMMDGNLIANRFEVSDSGDVVRFFGGVAITVKMDNIRERAAANNDAAAAAGGQKPKPQ